MPPKKPTPKPKKLTPLQRRRIAEQQFTRARAAEKSFQRQLVAVAKKVGTLVDGMAPGGKVKNVSELTTMLNRYAELIRPWARAVTERMHEQVKKRDLGTWTELSKEMARSLRKELRTAPTGELFRTALSEQVHLITSLPTEAAQRIHKLTTEGLMNSTRASEIEKEIMKSGQVTIGRAKLIARTETSRTAALLQESRARYIGSTHYVWHTVHDSDVRAEHRKLDGKTFAWKNPPVAGTDGMRYHPGQGPNCRCYAEPIIPDVIR